MGFVMLSQFEQVALLGVFSAFSGINVVCSSTDSPTFGYDQLKEFWENALDIFQRRSERANRRNGGVVLVTSKFGGKFTGTLERVARELFKVDWEIPYDLTVEARALARLNYLTDVCSRFIEDARDARLGLELGTVTAEAEEARATTLALSECLMFLRHWLALYGERELP
jgi:hypothetical protein